MNDELHASLLDLLERYPELVNKPVAFGDGRVSLADEARTCQQKLPPPEVIKGPSQKIELRRSPVHGYGVFAKESITAGDLVEEMNMLQLGLRRNYVHDPVLLDYIWANKKCRCPECQAHGHVLYVAQGFGSMYNHADKPNTEFKIDFARGFATLTAAQPIPQDEEIFLSYGDKYFLIRRFMAQVAKDGSLVKKLKENQPPKQ